MYDRLVIAIDGSEEAEHAARRGLELARAFDATVCALHVVEQKALRLTGTADEKTRLRESGAEILDDVETLASELDHPVTTTLTDGRPALQISEYADEQDADLIVVGRQGMTGLGKRLLGGVTEQVLHRSQVPVFVVPGEDGGSDGNTEYSRVLVPTDGSENVAAATPHGVTIAQQFDSTLHVLNVVDLQAAGGVFNAGGLEREFIERLELRGQEAVDKIRDEIADLDPDVAVRTDVERTTSFEGAAAGIREYVGDADIDLVVMSSHGRSNLKRQLLGSVASTVLRTVDVPVLVVKRPSE